MIKILIIDDTRSVHMFVKKLLAQGHVTEVASVYNGQEALDLLKQNSDFDLIFLDWNMPIMEGPETLQNIRKMGIQIPILMMTTLSSEDNINQMLELGVSEYMIKPFTVDILFQKIEFVLGKAIPYAS